MTPRSPDEALHFRGKTLTPESPRPLHVAEPANIPVLQNQMDPVFNDTSTYEKPEFALEGGQHVPHAAPRSQPQQQQNGQPPLEQQQQQQHAAAGSDSAGVRGSAGQMQDLGQQQQLQYQHPGSYHTGSLSGDEMMSKNETSSSAAFPPNLSAPTTTNATTSTATATTSGTRNEAERNDSLTALPLSDPSVNSLPHQASLNRPPPLSSSHAPQGFPAANEVDHPMTDWTAPAAPEARLDTTRASSHDNAPSFGEGGVDFQNLLDNLPSSSSAVPSAPAVSETAPSSMQNYASALPQATNNADGASDEALQNPMGLPPRPPAQEDPATHPNYRPSDDVSAYHQLPSNHPTSYPSSQPQSNNNHQSNLGAPALAAAGAPGTSSDASSLPPPPGLSLEKAESSSSETQDSSSPLKNGRTDKPAARSSKNNDEDAPWGPEVQRKYDDFLHNERIYVTEGLWDRFPPGSRLFVGNLPTERVTKRDLFHIFHKYGKLAQVSIKQAYGFIQFLDPSACKKALDAEQGAVVRGRKIHLEISKPQRNTRPGPAPPEPPRAPPRRSRSPPEFRGGPSNSRGLRAPGDRYDRNYEPAGRLPFSDFRDELTHRRRDDYRPPPRSPSPRGFRGRDGYRSRDRTPERYDRRDRRRSRSPPYGRDRRYRTPSPRGRSYDDADLPVPRRAPRDIPDVQILVLEEVDRNFIFHVENSFRNRGLRVDVLVLGPRIPLNAAVQRQIIEGVLAVVRLARPNQFSRKIPLQVFDRSGGADNLRFNDYPELEPNMAAEIVFHAQPQRGGPPVPFTSTTPFGIPPLPPPVQIPQPPLPPLSNQPNVANVMPSLDGSALQSILSALQQRPAVPAIQPPAFPPPNTPQAPADLASILNNATRPPVTAAPPQPMPPQPFPVQPPNAQMVTDPNLLSLLSKGLGGQQPQAHQGPMGPQVQNIINQLTKWKQ
ncbi:hypothetical protein SI65_05699 [Aspergillus cristatus]|uniref:RRM domain-containing protein n=1 Tax=Aspergillus cristatus TaxID=573508 RepID=A0A1E3BDN8_ASPCR|nr:hypothetical protein SI65_05699 [Aspergillus cristatus]